MAAIGISSTISAPITIPAYATIFESIINEHASTKLERDYLVSFMKYSTNINKASTTGSPAITSMAKIKCEISNML